MHIILLLLFSILGLWNSTLRAALPVSVAPTQTAEGTTLLNVDGVEVELITFQKPGSDKDNIVWVFTGDGFTAGDMSKFDTNVRISINRFLSKKPYNSFKNKINIYIARVKSSNSYGLGETVYGTTKKGERMVTQSTKGTNFKNNLLSEIEGSFLDSKDDFSVSMAANPNTAKRRIKAFQILINSNDYFGAGTLNGALSYYSIGSFDQDIDTHEMGHTHGLADEYPAYNYNNINSTAERLIENVPWKSFLGYKGVGFFQQWEYPRAKPTKKCVMYNDKDYCIVCEAYVFRQLNMSLSPSVRLPLYNGGIETTLVSDQDYVEDKTTRSKDGYKSYKDAHQLNNYSIDTIGSANLSRANGKRLEARTVLINFLPTPKVVRICLEIKDKDGVQKAFFSESYTLPAYNTNALYNDLPRSVSVKTSLLSISTGDVLRTYVEDESSTPLQSKSLTLPSFGAATLYLPYAYRLPSGLRAAIVKSLPSGGISVESLFGDGQESSVVPASTPLLILGAQGEYQLDRVSSAPAPSSAVLQALSANKLLHATGRVLAESGMSLYMLTRLNGVPGFYYQKDTDGSYLDNGDERCYLSLPTIVGGVQGYGIESLHVTGISSVEQGTSPAESVYDLTGRKSVGAPRSVVIRSRKKSLR